MQLLNSETIEDILISLIAEVITNAYSIPKVYP